MYRAHCIEVEVEFQDVDAGFAEEVDLAGFSVFSDERVAVGFGQVALAGWSRGLKRCGRRRDFRIEARSGRCEQIHRDRRKRSL